MRSNKTATLSGYKDNQVQMQPRDGWWASKTGEQIYVENKVGLKDKTGHLLGVWLDPDPEVRPADLLWGHRSLASDNETQLETPESCSSTETVED